MNRVSAVASGGASRSERRYNARSAVAIGLLILAASGCGVRPGALPTTPDPATPAATSKPIQSPSPTQEPTESPTPATYDWVRFVCLAVPGQLDAVGAVLDGARAFAVQDRPALEAARNSFHAAADPVVLAMPDSDDDWLSQPSAVIDFQNALLDFYSEAALAFQQSVEAPGWREAEDTLWRNVADLSRTATDAMEAALIRGLCG